MLQLHEQIESELYQLRETMCVDFASMAWIDPDQHLIRWRFASGNRNDRYKRIVLRPGKGFIGEVIHSSRPIVMEFSQLKPGDDPSGYAILLAEGLKSNVTVPVQLKSCVIGVLLVGCRSERMFTETEVNQIQDVANRLGNMLHS